MDKAIGVNSRWIGEERELVQLSAVARIACASYLGRMNVLVEENPVLDGGLLLCLSGPVVYTMEFNRR